MPHSGYAVNLKTNKTDPYKVFYQCMLTKGKHWIGINLFNFLCLQFIITEDNELYVWGASPQALRLQYQAKKRANATRKHEEEAARQAAAAMPVPQTPVVPIIQHNPVGVPEGSTIQTTSVDNNFELVNVITTSTSEPDSLAEQGGSGLAVPSEENHQPRSKSMNDLTRTQIPEHFQQPAAATESGNMNSSPQDKTSTEKIQPSTRTSNSSSISRGNSSDEESGNEHMYPTLVDTSDVEGNIIQVSIF